MSEPADDYVCRLMRIETDDGLEFARRVVEAMPARGDHEVLRILRGLTVAVMAGMGSTAALREFHPRSLSRDLQAVKMRMAP